MKKDEGKRMTDFKLQKGFGFMMDRQKDRQMDGHW